MKTLLLSSLNKVFKDIEPNFPEFGSYSILKNENFSFQIAFMAENNDETEISVSVNSPISENIRVYLVKNIPAGRNGFDNSDSYHYDLERKEFPDLLLPAENNKIKVNKGEWHSIWVEVAPNVKKTYNTL